MKDFVSNGYSEIKNLEELWQSNTPWKIWEYSVKSISIINNDYEF